MNIKTLTMIEADKGKMLKKDDIITCSVLLREGETAEGWTEIDIPDDPDPDPEGIQDLTPAE